jgi:GH18 family chitinase
MSVDADLFVCAGKEVALDLIQCVYNVLHNGKYFTNFPKFESSVMATVVSFYTHFNYLPFDADTEKRMLSIHFGCDSDYSDTYEGDKVILSLGCWGSSDEIMKTLAKELAQFGDVYYDHNDCDAEGFVKLYSKGE